MTIDEAIADCVRQVPECAGGWERVDEEASMGGVPMRGWSKSDHSRGTGWFWPDGDPTFRALWFEAAWEWLARQGPLPRIGYEGEEWTETETAMGSSWTGQYEITSGSWPTKYHWLRERVLLAKGIKP